MMFYAPLFGLIKLKNVGLMSNNYTALCDKLKLLQICGLIRCINVANK
ncbi:MAG: hypothetical protein JWP37_2045 [Mucilaginibacter sp.]|nr:hypothetical protein [Mucilaginibacter sp.]